MSIFEQSIDVHAPLSMVYNQWTQFEKFPDFMEGVTEVRQLDDSRLLWRAEIAGKREEWYARITEQTPDTRIAWTSVTGARNAGAVTFHYIDPETTRIMLQIEYEPEGVLENIGDTLGIVKARLGGDLERFKHYIEARGQESGGWRGTIDHDAQGNLEIIDDPAHDDSGSDRSRSSGAGMF